MLLDLAAGVVLIVGSLACAAAAFAGRPRIAWLLAAAGLACAAAAELLDTNDESLAVASCVLVTAGLTLIVLRLYPDVTRLSWLDAAMGASSTAALAVALGAEPAPAVATGGVVGVIALTRWSPAVPVLLALAGVAVLGAGEAPAPAAAALIGTAAWLPAQRRAPGPEFSPVVLSALLLFAMIALTLLTVGQFAEVSDVAVALAIVTVLTGMARAGLTVVERLRESRHHAQTDDLTGLGNRRHLVDRLDAAVASCEENGEELALLLIDLDGFKELNDTLGHHAGDQVLRQIGPRLSTLLRAGDTLARLGGDEFAVLLPATSGEGARRVAAALADRVRATKLAPGQPVVRLDASVGVADFGSDPLPTVDELFAAADAAMYADKRRSRHVG